uniref:MD-2-related lipid-recognition domain-containing protein n=1 Tax=Noccaea caerulescens TaxID=107243 RepID=A0A1J3CUK1_NOCCA
MKISHFQPLLLLLASSLFFLPALRAVDFKYCNKSGYDFGNVSRVEISPNPIEPADYELSITVSGYASKSIDGGSIEVYAKSENITDLLRRSPISPIKAGTKFEFPLSEVPKDILEGEYKYVIALLDDNVGDPEKPILCVDFDLPTSAPTLVSSA